MSTAVETTEIVQVVEQANLEKVDQQNIISVLGGAFNKISDFRAQADQISIEDEFDKDGMKAARELRLSVKKTRTEGENARKKLKEDALRKGNTIDAVWKIIKNGLEPIESELEEKEKTAERIQAKRREETQKARVEELSRYNFDGTLFPLGDMSDDNYEKLLESAKAGEEKRQADLLAAEQARIEAEKAEAQRIEQERIDRERAEAERKAEVARLQEENARLEAERKAKEEAEAKLRADQEARWQKAKLATEKALIKMGYEKTDGGMSHKEVHHFIGSAFYSEIDSNEEYKAFLADVESRLTQAKQAKEEKERSERLQLELEAKKKAEQDRIEKEEAERKAILQAEKASRLAPDKEKLIKLAAELEGYSLPDLSNPEGKEVLQNIRQLLQKVAKYAREKSDTF